MPWTLRVGQGKNLSNHGQEPPQDWCGNLAYLTKLQFEILSNTVWIAKSDQGECLQFPPMGDKESYDLLYR
eukprot:2306735-Amphidinium_carterae.2